MTEPQQTQRDTSLLSSQRNDPSFAHILDELEWRGYLHVHTDLDALRERLRQGPITYYCGFDPTAASLHLGHLVQLLLLRRLQLAGNHPIGLVGGSTGLIGDPRPTAERTLNSHETVAEWVGRLRAQIERYLDFTGEFAARMVNNLDWTAEVSALDFLRDIGKHFRVGAMLKKDAVAKRLSSPEGISYTEFSYQLLQSFDYLELYRRHGLELQTGGSDQWGNIVGGVDLIRRVEGAQVHALGTPLITNADGTKFGKTEGNAIWIDAELTSPYAFYQFWLNTADDDVVARLKIFTFYTRAEIDQFARQCAEAPHKRDAQKALAQAVCELVHGAVETQEAIAASEAVFGRGDLDALGERLLRDVLGTLPNVTAPGSTEVAQVLVDTGACDSLSDARRAIKQGGVTVNKVKVADEYARLADTQLLTGGLALVGRGKRTFVGAFVNQ